MPKKTETPTIEKNIVATVLAEIAADRKAAADDLNQANRDFGSLVDSINTRDQPIVEALTAARADMKALERFEGRLPKQQYDEHKRVAQAKLDDAEAAHKVASKAAQAEIAPMQERTQAAQTKVQDLAREFQSHARFAKAAGVDIKAYLPVGQ